MTGTTAVEAESSNNINNSRRDCYLREYDICNLTISHPFRLFIKRWKYFMGIALLASGLEALLEYSFSLLSGSEYFMVIMNRSATRLVFVRSFNDTRTYDEDGSRHVSFSSNLSVQESAGDTFMIIVNVVVVYVVQALARGAIIQLVSEMYAAADPTTTSHSAMDALGRTARKAVPVVGACLFVSLVRGAWTIATMQIYDQIYESGGGERATYFTMCASVVGVFITLLTYFILPATIVEKLGLVESIKRSLRLVKGIGLVILFVVYVYLAVRFALDMILWSCLWSFGYGNGNGIWIYVVASLCINAFFLAIETIVESVVYFHIRVKDEQLSSETLAAEMGVATITSYATMDEEGTASGKSIAELV